MLVRAIRRAGGRAMSPTRRLYQPLVTSTSRTLPDGRTASVILTRNGGVQ
jgi:hypothetical protein